MKTSALKASVDFWLELFSLSLSVCGVKVLLTVVHSLKDFQEGSYFCSSAMLHLLYEQL